MVFRIYLGGSPDVTYCELCCDFTTDSFGGGSSDIYEGAFAEGCTVALGGTLSDGQYGVDGDTYCDRFVGGWDGLDRGRNGTYCDVGLYTCVDWCDVTECGYVE